MVLSGTSLTKRGAREFNVLSTSSALGNRELQHGHAVAILDLENAFDMALIVQ